MKKLAILLFCLFSILVITTTNRVSAAATSVYWSSSIPSQVKVGNYATYRFSVLGTGTLSSGDCILSAYFSPLGTQSKAALEGTGAGGSGTAVHTSYGSAGMSAIAFSGTINLPAAFSMGLKNSSEVKPSSTGKVTVTYQLSCNGHLSSTKTVNIVGACYGKTCGCGSLPACKPKATPTPKPTTTTAPTKTPTPTASVTTAVSTYTFMTNGTEVTNLSTLAQDKRTNIENFSVESKGKNKIVFSEKVSLLDTAKLQNIDSYISLNEVGKVSIDSEKMPELNVPAVITMSGLTFKATPQILRNGEDAGDHVKNIQYDPATGVLTFEVTGFSTYTAVDASTQNLIGGINNTIFMFVGVIAVCVLALAGIGAFFLTKSAKTSNKKGKK